MKFRIIHPESDTDFIEEFENEEAAHVAYSSGECSITIIEEEMIELKTLKDLPTFFDGDSFFDEAIEINKLKQEAIKWVKLFLQQGEIQSAIDFQNFFNLTEEDLK